MADVRPWGKMWKLIDVGFFWAKIIWVFKGEMTSIQRHQFRSELHLCIFPGFRVRYYPRMTVHAVTPGLWVEAAWGEPLEDDNERLYDPHKRV